MTEKQPEPEPYVTIKIYKDGQATIEHEGKTLTTNIKNPEFRGTLITLTVGALFDRATGWTSKMLKTIFEGDKKNEQ